MDQTNVIVKHIQKQSSDHSMLILDTLQEKEKKRRRFYFDKRWLNKPKIEEVIRKAWNLYVDVSPMFQVASKIKRCRIDLIRLNNSQGSNSATMIRKLKGEIEEMKESDVLWDREKRNRLKYQLYLAYREEEQY